MSDPKDGMTYGESGVDTSAAGHALSRLAGHIKETFSFRDHSAVGKPLRGLGYYANVIDLGGGQGLALCSDGVGTKLMIAEVLGKYDTVGIDCIAMNVNDLICVGAEPLAMLDYVAVGKADADVLEQLGRGLKEGARQSDITIPGGELAQVKEMLRGSGATEGFDLVGTAVGLVPTDRMIFGQDVRAGDVVVGVSSNGVHSNGFTLARKVLAPNPEDLLRHEASFGRSIGEELLEPTALYVQLAKRLFTKDLDLHAICHITGDGYMNLTRVEASVGFELDGFPEPSAVFSVIQERGKISAAEMYSVYNMGIGLCVIVPEGQEQTVMDCAQQLEFDACVLGRVTAEDGKVRLPRQGLESHGGELVPSASL